MAPEPVPLTVVGRARRAGIRTLAASLVVLWAGSSEWTSVRAAQQVPGRTITFTQDVAPIVFARCAGCHHPQGPAPFSLLTYTTTRQHAKQIAEVTAARIMPPWKVEPGLGPFVGQDPLTDREIATIRQWVDQGALEGDPRHLPPLPSRADGWRLGTPDLIVALPEAYTLQAEGTDAFRIFAIPLPLARTRYVRGVEFHPGNAKVVHHANIRIDRTRTTRRLDEEDPAPGYEGLVAPSVADPDGHFLGWTPGQAAPLLPADLSWRLDPGTDLVLEVHMLPTGKPEAVRPSIGLFFSGDPPRRSPVMLRLGRQNIDIPAGDNAYLVTDSFLLPVDAELQAVQPHAHFRAREIWGLATLPDGSRRPLIHIRDWDFRWQHVYRFVTPVALPRGTTISMRYTYDNSARNPRNPQQPPRRVSWGQRSFDEMGDLWLQLLTPTEEDRAPLLGAIRPKMAAESLVGYETLIRADPGRVSLHDDAALLARELGRSDEEIAHFDAALKLQPRSAAAHQNLGAALADAGRLEIAIEHYRAALAIESDYALARTNLGRALLLLGRLDEAAREYRHAVRIDPSAAAAHNDLGYILLESGDTSEALSRFRDALRLDPTLIHALYNMGRALRREGRHPEALAHFRRALDVRSDWAPALANAAWLLATAPEESVRSPMAAVALAEEAARLTARRDPAVLDVLAAAYAARGAFEQAVETVAAALRLQPSREALAVIEQRRAAYGSRRPYRMPSGRVTPERDLLPPLR